MKPGKMPVKDMSYLDGRLLFPEKLKRAQEILAPFFSKSEECT